MRLVLRVYIPLLREDKGEGFDEHAGSTRCYVPANFGNPDKTRNESSTLLSVTRVSLSALGPVPFVQVDICPLNETLIEIEQLAG